MKMHPEDYRDLFTASAEKEEICIRHDGLVLGHSESPWDEAIALFDPALRERVPDGIMDHLIPDFSTATPETRTASMVAFMDAASPYYDFMVMTLCGIPEIRLLGTPDDYQKILAAASQLAERFDKHLSLYFQHLLPVLRTLVQQAEGAPIDHRFWGSIYKYDSFSGGDSCNGWLTAFVNYVHSNGKRDGSSTLMQKSGKTFDWKKVDARASRGLGISPASIPSHVCAVPFLWNYYDKEFPMTFIGGPLGIDNVDGYLTPSLSYGVLHQAR